MIKSSSNTSTTLKSNRVSNGSPLLRLFQSKIIASVLFLGLLILLVKLGGWQLNRGYEKQQLEQQLDRRQHMPSITTQEFIALSHYKDLLGRHLSIQASPTQHPLILLDNQTLNGKVGYLAFQLMQIAPKQPLMLIELGFIAADFDRSKLPSVVPFEQKQLQGRLYHKLSNPISNQLLPELGSSIRIQNLNIPQIEKIVNQSIFPVVLQPEAIAFDSQQQPLAKPWRPITMPAKKHFGYAMQWFSMALALMIIGLVIIRPLFFSFFSDKRSKDESTR